MAHTENQQYKSLHKVHQADISYSAQNMYLLSKLFSVAGLNSNGICWLLVLLFYFELYKLTKLQFKIVGAISV